jgi:CRISPR system Cascade subunit CasE
MTFLNGGSIFLSRLILNQSSRQVWNELANPYEMHRTLLRGFPEVSKDDGNNKVSSKFNILFRADAEEERDRVIVYVQSTVEPNWLFLHTFHGYLIDGSDMPNPTSKDIGGIYQKLRDGQNLAFTLRANPTKRVAKKDDPMRGKRVELTREEEQISWLIRKGVEREKGKPGGFELLMNEFKDRNGDVIKVPNVRIRQDGKQKGSKRSGSSSLEMSHFAVTFQGILRITNAKNFHETLIQGIGSGKAFGFGLLSVVPAPLS